MALTVFREEIEADYSRYLSISELDKNAIVRAREIFDGYKKRGVIVSGEFDDMSWTFTNETKNVGLTLFTFEGGTNKAAMSWIGCTYRQFVLCVKAYIVFHLGEISLTSLQAINRRFIRLALASREETVGMVDCDAHIIALLQLISGGNEARDGVIEELEEKIERNARNKKKGKQRRLADFRAYLRFQDAMTEFWRTADKRQKLFYFPLYFWWNLT
ncbi:MAG: hypothetical protein LBO03_10480, partial [Acidaminococcales bacterium]|nr:hypothetical protein [Acidaminococcales bacterium]